MAKIFDQKMKDIESTFKNTRIQGKTSDGNKRKYTFTELPEIGPTGNKIKPIALTGKWKPSNDPIDDYFHGNDDDKFQKTLIVLHFTRGHGVAVGDLMPHSQSNVSVSYIVTRGGTVYQLFEDDFYSGNIGPGATGNSTWLDKRSVAIEIVNIGALGEKTNANKLGKLKSKDGEGVVLYYCDKTDNEAYVELEEDFLIEDISPSYWATYTKKQIRSLKALLVYLTEKHSIPWRFLPESKRFELFSEPKKANEWIGIASHINFRQYPPKIDIGPAFPWHRLVPDYTFPVEIVSKKGFEVTNKNIKAYYEHTEKNYGGGYFPLGANTVWHGGLHIHAQIGDPVVACASGKIVAARLCDDKEKAYGEYGSRNFILMKHELPPKWIVPSNASDKTFYSLYMHLNAEKYDPENNKINKTKWLCEEFEVSREVDMFGVTPDVIQSIRQVRVKKKGRVKKGLKVKKIKERHGYCQISFEQNDPLVAWEPQPGVDRTEDKLVTAHVVPSALNPVKPKKEWEQKWGKNEIIKLDIPVSAGEQIWTVGEYGSELTYAGFVVLKSYRAPMIHWEIFSNKNLFKDVADWTSVEDTDEDFNMECKKILELVDKKIDPEDPSDTVLSGGEIMKFYSKNPISGAEKLRKYACKFVTEWGVDLEKALDGLEHHYFDSPFGEIAKKAMKKRIKPYLWWDQAEKAGVDLPAEKKVWHYNPIEFLTKVTRVGRESVGN